MTLEEYQEFTKKTAIYPKDNGKNFIYTTLGLVGEAGEMAEKMKKVIRDRNSEITEETKQEMIKELGDVFWYVSQLSAELGSSLGEVAEVNMKKLLSRKERGVIHGDGDNR